MRGSLAALLTGFLTVAFLFALTGFQVTSETPATRMLGRLGAAMIEIDRWVPAHIEDLDLLARDQPNSDILVQDLPVAVTLPASRVVAAQPDELSFLIRQRMGDALYAEGTDAFRTHEGQPVSLGFDEPARWAVSLLQEGRHGFWQLALLATAVLLLGGAALALSGGHLPLLPIAIGAAVATVLSLLGWGVFNAASSTFESAIDKEIMLIARDGAWVGVRNSAAVAVAAGLLHLLARTLLDHGKPAPAAPQTFRPPDYPRA